MVELEENGCPQFDGAPDSHVEDAPHGEWRSYIDSRAVPLRDITLFVVDIKLAVKASVLDGNRGVHQRLVEPRLLDEWNDFHAVLDYSSAEPYTEFDFICFHDMIIRIGSWVRYYCGASGKYKVADWRMSRAHSVTFRSPEGKEFTELHGREIYCHGSGYVSLASELIERCRDLLHPLD